MPSLLAKLRRPVWLGLAALALGACSLLDGGLAARQTDSLRHLVILYTNDEHGWMEGYQNTSGAAGMARLWRQREGLGENDHLLVLSGGDMWTGPALSTVLKGESMAEVMNRMGYAAAAIGNHDFDFGQEALRARLAQSEFPFLAANIRIDETGEIPDFAQPYLVTEVNGVSVGIIGLTTTETKVDTKPAHVADLQFMQYRDVIPTFAAKARGEGAELLMIIAHVCAAETRRLAPLAAEYGIEIIGGGHCHEEVNELVDGVHLVESGYFMRGYIRFELLFDTVTGQVAELEVELVRNDSSRLDEQVTALMEQWRTRTDPALWETIGYVDQTIDRQSPEMASLLLKPWLASWPSAQVALADPRYVQQDLYPGEITPASIVGLLSTDNQLIEVELTGAQLVETLEARRLLVAGVLTVDDQPYAGDAPIDPHAVYRVLVSESLYAGGNGYTLNQFDTSPESTGVNWRDPPIEWIQSIDSNRRQPLNAYLED